MSCNRTYHGTPLTTMSLLGEVKESSAAGHGKAGSVVGISVVRLDQLLLGRGGQTCQLMQKSDAAGTRHSDM